MTSKRMTVAEEAHWSYQLEWMTNWGYNIRYQGPFGHPPDEVVWLREQARYMTHLANAQARRAAP